MEKTTLTLTRETRQYIYFESNLDFTLGNIVVKMWVPKKMFDADVPPEIQVGVLDQNDIEQSRRASWPEVKAVLDDAVQEFGNFDGLGIGEQVRLLRTIEARLSRLYSTPLHEANQPRDEDVPPVRSRKEPIW